MALNESIQEEVRDEIRQHSDDIDVYCGRKDTLLANCLKETLRLRPFTGNRKPRYDIISVLIPCDQSSPSRKVPLMKKY